MAVIGAREANRSFSKILKEAEQGKTVTITRNGKPIAQIGPAAKQKSRKGALKARDAFLALLERGMPLGGPFTRDDMNER